MKRLFLTLWFWLFCWPAFAGVTCSLPFTLTNGTIADATQVMANYNALVNCFANSTAESGANSSITSLSGLTTPLTTAQGGTPVYLGGTSTGSANAQVLATTSPINFTIGQKSTVYFVAGFTNTGATTLQVGGTAATNVTKRSFSGPVSLTGGEIHAGNAVAATYDGTQYEIVNDQPGVGIQTSIASAATVDLGTVASHNALITGTTTITSFGTTAITDFPIYVLKFNNVLTLTYNATSMILPSTANITTAANDTAIAVPLGGGNWQVISYQTATGVPLGAVNAAMDIQVFTATGANTWTKRTVPPVSFVQPFVCAGGGGGGGGARNAASTATGGGGGGAGGNCATQQFKSADVGASQTVTLGTGGTAGSGATSNASSGTNGGAGNNSTFGSLLTAVGGALGTGGDAATGNGGTGSATASDGRSAAGGSGGTGGGSGGGPGASPTNGLGVYGAAPGGGGGAGFGTGNAGKSGGTGGLSTGCQTAAAGGNTAGGAGSDGGSGAADFNYHIGCGGGGGGSATVTRGGNGGAGTNGGGGGGGGAGDAVNAGNGGVGGNGFGVVVSW